MQPEAVIFDIGNVLTRWQPEAFYDRVVAAGIRPLTGGGDHLCSLPILRAVAKSRPVGMIQFDSHTDLNDIYFGTSRYNHGTPFRRAVERG